jgi:tetratricopeptide (TPR) repeat protein
MSKNKKHKVVSLSSNKFSPENYIKSQARSLPIIECLITAEWEGAGICTIIVARGHKTGNVTVGSYLVDLYCLGLKDTGYRFNATQTEYNELKQGNSGLKPSDYTTAHNIIYGAIAYAEDFGFKPHKDFSVSQFILEADDDHIELLEFEFGLNGKPCYMPGPYDEEAKINRIEATLKLNAGEGNYSVVYTGGFDDDGFSENEYDGLLADKERLMDDLEKANNEFIPLLKGVNKLYDDYIRPPEAKEKLEQQRLGTKYELTEEPLDHGFGQFDDQQQENLYNELYKRVFNDDKHKKVIKELQKAIEKYPDKAVFYNLLQSAYITAGQIDKADETVLETYRRFPGYLFAKVAYANLLIDEKQFNRVLPVFNGKADLNDLYPERSVFHVTEASALYCTLCRYFLFVGDIDSADLYMNAILENDLTDIPGQNAATIAIRQLIDIKMKKLGEVREEDVE